MMNELQQAVFLTGATASGKTSVGIALALRLDAEIVLLDSMTLYRGMDIGTAKPTASEQKIVPHHLLDRLDPWEASDVATYRDWALSEVRRIQARGKIALFVGGTALYLKALLRGLFQGPGTNPSLRLELETQADSLGNTSLHQRLFRLDPEAASRLHPNDRRRVVRALEVVITTGQPISRWQTSHATAATGFRVFAINRDRDDLNARIDQRVDAMFAFGFEDEVRRLLKNERPLHRVPAQAVGYREVIQQLDGQISSGQSRRLIKTRTRQFAKHQRTWFRGLSEVQPIEVAAETPIDEIAELLCRRLASSTDGPEASCLSKY